MHVLSRVCQVRNGFLGEGHDRIRKSFSYRDYSIFRGVRCRYGLG